MYSLLLENWRMTLACGDGEGARKPSLPAGVISVSGDLDASIREHSLFFDRLVELIPARFYLPSVDEDKPWYQGLSKVEKASAKAESRRHLKEARRARLDPQKSATTLDLLKKSIEVSKSKGADDGSSDEEEGEEEEEENEKDDGDEHAGAKAEKQRLCPVVTDDDSVTYEELRQRLQRRIEEFRACRNTRNPVQPRVKKEKKKKWKNKKKDTEKEKEGDSASQQQKRKRDELETTDEKNGEKSKKAKAGKGGKDPTPIDLTFGHVKIGGSDENMKKRKKLSKQHELAKAVKLQEAKKDPEKGEAILKKHSWKAAVDRAAGVKVHDDPKLLKESIKKDKKRQKKSAEQWKERMQNINKNRAEKQKTRTDNIKERIHQKKMRKIEKREKKLMRQGSQGRKDGHVNE